MLALAAFHAGATETRTMQRISGDFDVKVTPLTLHEQGGDKALGRMALDKQYHGELQAVARGEMLTALTGEKGSAGYVAIERVSGTLAGRTGTFVLQHSGVMTRGAQSLSITVVPDSATGQLAGLAGKMGIRIEGPKHFYDFEDTLP